MRALANVRQGANPSQLSLDSLLRLYGEDLMRGRDRTLCPRPFSLFDRIPYSAKYYNPLKPTGVEAQASDMGRGAA